MYDAMSSRLMIWPAIDTLTWYIRGSHRNMFLLWKPEKLAVEWGKKCKVSRKIELHLICASQFLECNVMENMRDVNATVKLICVVCVYIEKQWKSSMF